MVKDIEAKGPKVGYERLLDAVSREYGLARAALTGNGRQRPWIEGRRFLVYLAREWGKMTTEDLGKRLERDPSMISRLYRDYEGNRELARERRVAVALTPKIQTQTPILPSAKALDPRPTVTRLPLERQNCCAEARGEFCF